MKPHELLEAARKGIDAPSNYALHKATGISEQALSAYEKGQRWPDNTAARKLAEAAGLPWPEVIAALEVEKAKDEQTATAWGKALASLRRSAAAVVLAAVALFAAVQAQNLPSGWFVRRRLCP